MLQRLANLMKRDGRSGDGPPVSTSAGPVRPRAPLPLGWRETLVVCLLLLACSFVLAWPWISGEVALPWDGRAHFHAQAVFLAQSIHAGQSPFWAPYVFAGHPQIADPQSLIFSPQYLLLALLTPNPTFAMVDGVAFASLVFGAFGILGFARDRRWHPAAVIVAALAFAYGGAAAWRIQHVGQILSLSYFPWALWMLERGLRLGSARYGALAGFFTAMTVLGPDQVSFLELVVLTGFVVAHWLGGGPVLGRMRASLRPLTAGGLVGILIVTVPSLMVLSFAEGSNRAHITLEDAGLGSLHPSNLLSFLIANLFGTIGPGPDFWGAPSMHWPYIVWSNLARNMTNFYMGALPAFGILLWMASKEAYSRRFRVFVGLFLVMIAYALGTNTPVFPALYHLLPGADLFRRPADSLFLVGALGAILAGFGLDALLRRAPAPLSGNGLSLLLAATLVAVIAGTGMAIWLGRLEYAWPDIAIGIATILAGLAVLAVGVKYGRAFPLRVALLFAACLTADLAWNIRPNHSTGLEPDRFDVMRPETGNETIRFLKERIVQNGKRRDRVELAGLGFEWPNAPLVHQLESTLGYNPLRMGFYGEATGARDHVAGWDQRAFGNLMPSYRSPFANLLGLRYIVTSVPIERIDPALAVYPLPLIGRTADGYIYENPDALPRVMIVPSAVAMDQDKLVRTGAWPSVDLRKVAFVEPSALPLPPVREEKTAPATEGAGPAEAKTGKARITHYENTRVVVSVEAPEGGVLLLNDVYHPWWFATIDGMQARILRANGAFRAVVLPRGAKEVVFTFEPLRGLARHHLVRRGIITN